MAYRVFFLTVTVAINAALLAVVFRPQFLPTVGHALFARLVPDRDNGLPERTPKQKTAFEQGHALAAASSAAIWSRLYSPDLATLLLHLRAAGFPPALVRSILEAEVENRFSPRIKALMRTRLETPFWRPDPSYYAGSSKLFEEVNQIYRERSQMMRDLLGSDAYAGASEDPAAAPRHYYGNLAPAKADLVQRINEDYAELTGQIRAAMQGVALTEDREKLALLEREKRADLAAVLSPEELAEHDMRSSPTTMRLRTTFTVMDATEAEFRSIYQVHESFRELLYPANSTGLRYIGSEVSEKRREANNRINEQLKIILGDVRYADYQRAGDSEFQQLYRLGQRDNIAHDTLLRAHAARGQITEAATKIVDDSALTAEAKLSELRKLGQEGRTQLLSTLGPSAGPTYVEYSRWLNQLDQGRVLIAQPDGSTTQRTVPVGGSDSNAARRR